MRHHGNPLPHRRGNQAAGILDLGLGVLRPQQDRDSVGIDARGHKGVDHGCGNLCKLGNISVQNEHYLVARRCARSQAQGNRWGS